MKLSALWINYNRSLSAMSLGDWFHISRKGGTGGGGLVHPKGENSLAMSGLASIGPFLLLSANGLERQSFHFIGPPCSVQG